jgi:predicted metal-dependent hydrolase
VEAAVELDPREAWLYGIDLFNTRYFWEAHEAWEKVWQAAPDGSRGREVVKGLIQIAAGLLKLHLGNEAAARRLAARGAKRIEAAAVHHGVFRGLSLGAVVHAARAQIVDAAAPLTLEAAVFELTIES